METGPSPMSAQILIVDDEAGIRQMLSFTLGGDGYACTEAGDTDEAQSALTNRRPDLILLDWMLPGISGVDFARRLKRDPRTSDIPVILLTAKGEEADKVKGLDSGADDYITKPFSTRELVSRIRAVMRRTSSLNAEKVIEAEGLKLDPVSHRITADDRPVEMGPTEYRLLAFFMSHQERAYSRTQMLDQVWGGNVYVEDRTIDVHIRRLRKALEPFGYDRFIQTVRGTGYRFSTRVDSTPDAAGASAP